MPTIDWEPLRRRQQVDHTAGAHAPEHLVGLLADSVASAPLLPYGREWPAYLRALADHIYGCGVHDGTRTALEREPARMVVDDSPRLRELLATWQGRVVPAHDVEINWPGLGKIKHPGVPVIPMPPAGTAKLEAQGASPLLRGGDPPLEAARMVAYDSAGRMLAYLDNPGQTKDATWSLVTDDDEEGPQ